jgi:hypothetical protein
MATTRSQAQRFSCSVPTKWRSFEPTTGNSLAPSRGTKAGNDSQRAPIALGGLCSDGVPSSSACSNQGRRQWFWRRPLRKLVRSGQSPAQVKECVATGDSGREAYTAAWGGGSLFARMQHVRHRYAWCCRPAGVSGHITCKMTNGPHRISAKKIGVTQRLTTTSPIYVLGDTSPTKKSSRRLMRRNVIHGVCPGRHAGC